MDLERARNTSPLGIPFELETLDHHRDGRDAMYAIGQFSLNRRQIFLFGAFQGHDGRF